VIIAVGDPSIEWGRLGPQADSKKIVLIEGEVERVVGITTEEIKVVEVNGQPALQRTQAAESGSLGNRVATTVVLRSTFEPISHHDEHAGATISLHYSGLTISGMRESPDGKVEPIHTTLDRPVFDAHSVEMILRVLPLRQDDVAKLPVYHARLGQVMWVTLRVTGNAEVAVGGGRIADAWIVETEWGRVPSSVGRGHVPSSVRRGHARVTYWIGEKTPELLKQSSVLPSGAVLQFVR
jgi:hypothetical protein